MTRKAMNVQSKFDRLNLPRPTKMRTIKHSGLALLAATLTVSAGTSRGWTQATTDKAAAAQGIQGYYRQPTLRGDTLIFVAEGDLWKASFSRASSQAGAVATRLTSHPGDESTPKLSPDGSVVAFTAQYEGPTEVYVMPVTGGLPTRLTFDSARASVVGWTNLAGDNPARVMATTTRFSTLPSVQLTLIDPVAVTRELVPLAQASDGCYDAGNGVLYFTRIPFNGSHTKRYKGGTIQQLWKFDGASEAIGLTTNFPGTSYAPMFDASTSRIYHLSDRDGTMDLWSMDGEGNDLTQLTDHNIPGVEYLDVKGPSMDGSSIVYQLGADLWSVDTVSKEKRKLLLTLDSDFDQTRERWVKKPQDYITSSNISPDGDRVAITARGSVFIVPRREGRIIELPRLGAARHRDGRFMPGGTEVLAISDQTGETELFTLPIAGNNPPESAAQLTSDSTTLRWQGIPSPDGRFIVHHDKDQRLFLLDTTTKGNTQIDSNQWDNFSDIVWATDSTWFAYVNNSENQNPRIKLHNALTGENGYVTTDRFASYSPSFSHDGAWLYFLSDRSLMSTVGSPWGLMQPEPHFDNVTQVYAVSLNTPAPRWPYAPDDELFAAENAAKKKTTSPEDTPKDKPTDDTPVKPEPHTNPPPHGQPPAVKPDTPTTDPTAAEDPGALEKAKALVEKAESEKVKNKPLTVTLDGIESRLYEVPLASGNYSALTVQEKRLLFMNDATGETKPALSTYPIANRDLEVKVVIPDVSSYQVSGDGKSMLVRKGGTNLHILDSAAAPGVSLDKTQVNLNGWTFSITPREEWNRMFTEAWRLERDYFWDSNMHGVDWPAMLERYRPLAARVSTRAELNDVIAQMVGELSALHIFVRGGDLRVAETDAAPASLGGILVRDAGAGGHRIETIFESDPDEPARRSPLASPGVELRVGDIITHINGKPTLTVPDVSSLLRGHAGRQVLITAKLSAGGEKSAIIVPITAAAEEDLRYHQWQYTRRLKVDKASDKTIGYVHMRAMGNENFTEFAKGYYPVYQRQGLIVDARNNRGGNIDAWVLSRLLRQAWFYWSPDVGSTYWNMHFAFRGHIVVLCNERTASDGEALAEGFRRLKLGTIIGTRTWGGEIWLSSSNFLVDGGIATAAETGVFGPEGTWLIEGHGVDPDIVVDNLPHATFKGEDAQLMAAIEHLKKKISEDPRPVPPTPKRPDKSWKPNQK